jgi:hypothetical protein
MVLGLQEEVSNYFENILNAVCIFFYVEIRVPAVLQNSLKHRYFFVKILLLSAVKKPCPPKSVK